MKKFNLILICNDFSYYSISYWLTIQAYDSYNHVIYYCLVKTEIE